MVITTVSLLVPRGTNCERVGPDCPLSESYYGYAPSLPPNVILLVLFGLALVAHTAQGIYYRTWGTLTAFFFGCVCELLGM